MADNTDASVLEAHSASLVQIALSAFSDDSIVVKESGVLLLHSLVESLPKPCIAASYSFVVPALKELAFYLHNVGADDLSGQAVGTLCLLGEAAGKERFYADAIDIVAFLRTLQSKIDTNVGIVKSSDLQMFVLKAWVRVIRCIGVEALPHLDELVSKILGLITQDVRADYDDGDDAEQRSDVVMVETEEGWQAVRSAAVEEQSEALQMLLHLAENLQQIMAGYVDVIMKAIGPLVSSPHEDIRSFSLVLLPELVRVVFKANNNDQALCDSFLSNILHIMVGAIESEASAELIMTGLQALRSCIENSSVVWRSENKGSRGPAVLSAAQMDSLAQCSKIILRDSLQRRAVLRAEARVSGGLEDGDVEDETLFMSETMELLFNIAELLNVIFKTNGMQFMPTFVSQWHDAILTMADPACLKEDRQFSFLVICDVIEFGLDENSAGEYLSLVIPLLTECCAGPYDPAGRQSCCYALGTAAQRFPVAFNPFVQVTSTSVSRAD